MTPEPLPPHAFKWLVSLLTIAGALWALYDVIKWRKLRGKDRRDPLVRDERFGYVVGIAIGLFALAGILRYLGVLP